MKKITKEGEVMNNMNEKQNLLSSHVSYSRIMGYDKYGWTIEALSDKNYNVRYEAYENLGWTEEAKKDEYYYIRLEAYKELGWTEEAFNDEDCYIRMEAYKELGWIGKALEDEDCDIRIKALDYFIKCKDILELEHMKTVFTPDEAMMLELNGIKVNKLAILRS